MSGIVFSKYTSVQNLLLRNFKMNWNSGQPTWWKYRRELKIAVKVQQTENGSNIPVLSLTRLLSIHPQRQTECIWDTKEKTSLRCPSIWSRQLSRPFHAHTCHSLGTTAYSIHSRQTQEMVGCENPSRQEAVKYLPTITIHRTQSFWTPVVFSSSKCLYLLGYCHVIGWWTICANKR